MQIAILGSGQVGRFLAGAFRRAGHDVTVGTRDPDATRSRDDWAEVDVPLAAYADLRADVFVNATRGDASLAALQAVGPALDGAVVIDTSNPLDFSQGFPPSLFVVNTESLAERLQAAFPGARLVKMFNTMNHQVMVDPTLAPGSTIFLAGDDQAARQTAAGLAGDLGWTDVMDLGVLSAARGLEMYIPLWLAIGNAVGSWTFNIKVVR